MEIRPVQPGDLELMGEIDGTIDSGRYLHVDRQGEGLGIGWTLQERPLRERRVRSNPIDAERRFLLRQIAAGADEGVALMVERDDVPVALLVAVPDSTANAMRLVELRVDFDYRRQGLATALIFQTMAAAREREMRAVVAETQTDNMPAAMFLAKLGFAIAGLDSQRWSNHDLVKEAVTLFWYAPLD